MKLDVFLISSARKQHTNTLILCKELIVEYLYVLNRHLTAGINRADPAGCAAVTAVYDRQIMLMSIRFCLIQIGFKDEVSLFRIHFSHDAAQLAHPYLKLYLQEWAEVSLDICRSRMRNKSQHGIQQDSAVFACHLREDVAEFITDHVRLHDPRVDHAHHALEEAVMHELFSELDPPSVRERL